MNVEVTRVDGDGSGSPSPDRRSIGLLIVAAVVVVLAVMLVVVFGVQRPPELPTLVDEPSPSPSGSIAWTTYRDQPCLDVAAPNGQVRELRCASDVTEVVGWDRDEGVALVDWSGTSASLRLVDPATSELRVLDAELEDDWMERHRPGGSAPWSRRDGGELVLEGPGGQELWRVEAPDSYELRSVSLSPDGQWLAAVDSAERIVLVPVAGEGPVRVWASGVDTWMDPIWEGGLELDEVEGLGR